jgi:hypothetical protein
MKKLITIGTPHRRDFTPEYVMSLAATLRSRQFAFSFLPWEGTQIYQSRNIIFMSAIGDLLFIDTDSAWTPEDIGKLVELDKDICGGYYLSGDNGKPVVFNVNQIEGQIPDIPGEPFQVDFVGTGFMLIKRRVIETFKQARVFPFDLLPVAEACPEALDHGYPATYLPEDVSFCLKAKRLFSFEVWCAPDVKIGHIKTAALMDPQAKEKWRASCSFLSVK